MPRIVTEPPRHRQRAVVTTVFLVHQRSGRCPHFHSCPSPMFLLQPVSLLQPAPSSIGPYPRAEQRQLCPLEHGQTTMCGHSSEPALLTLRRHDLWFGSSTSTSCFLLSVSLTAQPQKKPLRPVPISLKLYSRIPASEQHALLRWPASSAYAISLSPNFWLRKRALYQFSRSRDQL
jgi:hypothetical protein